LFLLQIDILQVFFILFFNSFQELYKNGLQRELFLPFIDLLMQYNHVYNLSSGTDYRLTGNKSITQVYHSPLTVETSKHVESIFQDLCQNVPVTATTLNVDGRLVTIPRTARGVAWCSFEELCERALGPADYIALSQAFHTVFLVDIPQMTPLKRNEARRFINLIDELYNHKVLMIDITLIKR
jgi:cell division protein ZapE